MKRTSLFLFIGVLLYSNAIKADEQLVKLTEKQAIEIADFINSKKEVILLFPCCHSFTKKSIWINEISVLTDDKTGEYVFKISGNDYYGEKFNETVNIRHIYCKKGLKAKCVIDNFDLAIGHPRSFRWKKYW